MTFPVAVSPSGRVALVRPTGELDVAFAGALRSALREAAASEAVTTTVLDLSEVSFVDSTILGVIVEGHRAVGPDGRLLVRGASGLPMRTLRLTGLDSVLDLYREGGPLDDELAGLTQG